MLIGCPWFPVDVGWLSMLMLVGCLWIHVDAIVGCLWFHVSARRVLCQLGLVNGGYLSTVFILVLIGCPCYNVGAICPWFHVCAG